MESSDFGASTSATASSNNGSNGSILVRKRGTMMIENPFSLKVGQVFTGFGVGCGLGIGVGRPLNLGAIPVLNQVMSAASGATYAFYGIGGHVNNSLKKIGEKNIEAGIGCGVGFGHGFGVGLALKPGVVHQIQLYTMEAMSKIMVKFGATPNLSNGQGVPPTSLHNGSSVVHGSSSQDHLESVVPFGKKIPDVTNRGSEGVPLKLSSGTRTEKLIYSFLQDPILRGENTQLQEMDGRLQSENRVLRMVLKHQQIIEELMEENERLRRILVEDLKSST